jgi:hypothetical protein
VSAPNYGTDLTDVDLAQNKATWLAYGGGASGLDDNPDIAMQGTQCVAKQISAADRGQYFDNGSGITLGTSPPDHVFVWLFCGTPGLTDTLANKGVSIFLGSATTAYCQYHVEGNNTYGAAGRVARCYPIDYSLRTASTGFRTVSGTPGAAPRYFGGGLVTTATVKGFNCGVDAIRYGTGLYITGGDLGSPYLPGTFAGAQAINDTINNRYGVLTGVGGGYELQGRFVIGQNNAYTATAAQFEDSNINLALVDTPHSSTDFTQIIVDHASTVFNLTNSTVQALGTHNPGRLVYNNASTVSALTGCNFLGLGITTLRAGVTATNCTWRGADAVTLNSATMVGCIFAESVAAAAVIATDLADLDGCEFVSGGTGHAVNLGTVSSDVTMNWNSTDSGYAATDGSTGNETILVNVSSSGNVLTINVAAGASTPTIYNTGPGMVDVVSGQVTTTITVVDVTDQTVIENARVYLIAGATGPLTPGTEIFNDLTNASGQVSDLRSLGSNQSVTGWVRKGSATPFYKTSNIVGSISSANGLELTVQMIPDE